MTTSMTQKNPKRWCFFYSDGFLDNNKRAYFKKGPREELALNMSFQTKKNIWLYIEQWSNDGGATSSNLPSEKNVKQVFEIADVAKKTCFILRMSLHWQMIKFWLFFRRFAVKNSTKNYMNKSELIRSNGFSYTQNEKRTWSVRLYCI